MPNEKTPHGRLACNEVWTQLALLLASGSASSYQTSINPHEFISRKNMIVQRWIGSKLIISKVFPCV